MINLPKRSDDIYKEIENFEDYEFTNCIAYEMAIRNEEVINLSNKAKLIMKKTKRFDYDAYHEAIQFRKKISNEIIELDKFGLNYNSNAKYFLLSSGVSCIFTVPHEEQLDKLLTSNELEEVCNIERHAHNYSVLEDLENMNTDSINEGEMITVDLDILETNQDFIERYPLIIEGICQEESKSIIINALKRKQLTILKDMYSRPKIRVENTNFLQVKINPNIPKDELIAYISTIKDEYDKDNSIIKSPLELLEEKPEKTNNKKINKKLIADKFFVYDYVKARLEQIKEDNLSMYEEYEEQKQEIINNEYIDSSDRKIQLKELKRELEENTNTRVPEILEDIEGFSGGTAKRYYYDIRPFIDECKYKELITGTTAK